MAIRRIWISKLLKYGRALCCEADRFTLKIRFAENCHCSSGRHVARLGVAGASNNHASAFIALALERLCRSTVPRRRNCVDAGQRGRESCGGYWIRKNLSVHAKQREIVRKSRLGADGIFAIPRTEDRDHVQSPGEIKGPEVARRAAFCSWWR